MWNAKHSDVSGELVTGIPDDLLPLLREIGDTHLHNLVANAQAWREDKKHYAVLIQGTRYVDLPVSRYRSWCLERLQQRFEELPQNSRDTARQLLEAQDCWEPLWRIREPRSLYDHEHLAPFAMGLKVYLVEGA